MVILIAHKWETSQTLVFLLSRELQRDVKTLRKVVEQMSTQMDSQAVRERPKIAALLEEVNVIKETMNIQVRLEVTLALISFGPLTHSYQMELRWRFVIRVKNVKNWQKWIGLVVYNYIECISSKNDQFIIEKFANWCQIHDNFFWFFLFMLFY